MFNPIAETEVTTGLQRQAIESSGHETNLSLASVELNRHTTEIVKITQRNTHHPQANNLSGVGNEITANQMIIEPLPQDIQGQERVNVIVDQEQEPQNRRGDTTAPLVTEAVSQAEDDLQMSVHSDLGLSSGFPLSASEVVALVLVSSSFLISGKASTTEVPRKQPLFYLFLASVISGTFALFCPFSGSVHDRRFLKTGVPCFRSFF
jgi:hypothetical protein